MNLPNEFEYYLEKGIIRKISADKSRAQFLIESSRKSFEGLKLIIKQAGIIDFTANNIIKDSYDIIMELIRAKLLLDGYNSIGQFGHEAEISYLRKLKFADNNVSFLNDLRYNRNGAMYYGKLLDREYAKQVVNFLERIYPLLLKQIIF